DALAPGAPAVAVVVERPHATLELRALRVRAGRRGEGDNGAYGVVGARPEVVAGDGAPPRGALESQDHVCTNSDRNRVLGGAGGRHGCPGGGGSGGDGGGA